MKKIFVVLAMGMISVFLVAGIATADDIIIDINNRNDINATGGDASSDQSQEQMQDQKQQQVMKTPTQLMNLQYGTNFVNPGLGIQNKGWNMYQSAVYSFLSYDEVKRMRREFQLSDLFFFWKASRVKVQMINGRLAGKPAGISLMNYWPKDVMNKGDKVIAAVRVKGEAEWNEESFLGLAAEACMEKAGSDRMAVLFTTDFNGVTSGMAVSVGGATSTVFSGGTKGAVATGGGQIGTIETSVEEHETFKVLCMNPGPLNYYPPTKKSVQPTSAPPVVEKKPEPAPQPAVCDPTNIWAQINELKRRVALCTQFCFNNLQLRAALGEKYIDLAVCTGDKRYLNDANKNFEIAERNHKFGNDIKKNRTEASAIMRRVYYLQAGCLNQIYGLQVATDFAAKKNLEKFPMSFEQ